MTIKCRFCGSGNVRTSRLRFSDVRRLVRLEMPVRCRACNHRDYIKLGKALGMRRIEKARLAEHERRRAATTDKPKP